LKISDPGVYALIRRLRALRPDLTEEEILTKCGHLGETTTRGDYSWLSESYHRAVQGAKMPWEELQ
jgi:hypothetical protein